MWNIFKKKDMVVEQLAKTNAELEKKLIERNNENTTLNRNLQMMTEDRDYWKSQSEEFVKTYDSEYAKLGEKIQTWVAKKMLHNMGSSIELQKLKDRIDNASPEEAFDVLEKAAGIKKENEILNELGKIILDIMKKD